jgi:hypothetical protein
MKRKFQGAFSNLYSTNNFDSFSFIVLNGFVLVQTSKSHSFVINFRASQSISLVALDKTMKYVISIAIKKRKTSQLYHKLVKMTHAEL